MFEPEFVQTFRLTPGQLPRPGTPGGAGMDLAHHRKEHKVFQPPRAFPLEVCKAPEAAVASFQEILRGLAQQRQLEGLDLCEVDAVAWRLRRRRRWPSKANCPGPAARAEGLAIALAAPRPESRQRHGLPGPGHRCRPVKAERWDGAGFRRNVPAALVPDYV